MNEGKSNDEICREFSDDYIDFEVGEMALKLQRAREKKGSTLIKVYAVLGMILTIGIVALISYILGLELSGKADILNGFRLSLAGFILGFLVINGLNNIKYNKIFMGYASSTLTIAVMILIQDGIPVIFGQTLGDILLILFYSLAIVLLLLSFFVNEEYDYQVVKIRRVLQEENRMS